MHDLDPYPLTPRQRDALPLAFRRIFYKDIPRDGDSAGKVRVADYDGEFLPRAAFQKPISRL